ncbi:MAG: FHA domain-containing protein [Alphaproteobacteria bacterium]|nr:FHA domain-containing protein [Alphaproteobacteria bacterium]MCB9696078.1 FHA domain-containing protein [Alphaproteobacteria bacterium]
MAVVYELLVEGDSAVSRAVSVGNRPFAIGRGPSNDLVVPDGLVSWEHAKIWADGAKIWCADMSSTNGTFVNDQKITGTVQLDVGDCISVGGKLRLKVQLHGKETGGRFDMRSIALEEVATGLKHPFRSTRFIVGSAMDADLRLPDAPPYAAEFAYHGVDDLWMMVENEDRQLDVGQTVEVAGLTFRLIEVDIPRAPTIQPQRDRFPYRLSATLDGPTGPLAELENLDDGRKARVEAETRAILLFLLGRKVDEDRKSGKPRDEIGWCADDDIIVGVWGRGGLADGANRLKVLVHRLRAEVGKAGFDPWLIERRKRFIRIRIREFAG